MSGYLNNLVQRAIGLGVRVPAQGPGRGMPGWKVSGMAPLLQRPAASIAQSVPLSAAGISATHADPLPLDTCSTEESSGEPARAVPTTPLDDKPEAEALFPRQAVPRSPSPGSAAPDNGRAEAVTTGDNTSARAQLQAPIQRVAPASERSRPSADPVRTGNDIGHGEGPTSVSVSASTSESEQERSPIQRVSPAVKQESEPTLLMPVARSNDPESSARSSIATEGVDLPKASLKRETEQPVSRAPVASAAIARERSNGNRPTPSAKHTRMQLPLAVPARPSPVAFEALPRGQVPDRVGQSSSVQVRIGRVEVRAVPAPQASAPAVPTARPMGGFDDYLSLRSYGRTV
jgi:hypothetical protein